MCFFGCVVFLRGLDGCFVRPRCGAFFSPAGTGWIGRYVCTQHQGKAKKASERTHRGDVVGLEVVDDLADGVEPLLDGEDKGVVHRAHELRHLLQWHKGDRCVLCVCESVCALCCVIIRSHHRPQ